MYSLLLAIIYVAFISLGLPDSLIGAGWPAMQTTFSVPLSYAGMLTVIIACGTVISSLKSDYLTKRYGTGLVTACSVATTALAILGFAFSPNFWVMCLCAIPYGLGAGAVDASLNNFVALHYKARHMSWLHCFWGVGAATSPYLMSLCLTNNWGWRSGFNIVGVIQIALTAALLFSLPMWKKMQTSQGDEVSTTKALTLSEILKIRGVPLILITFFCYCGIEQTTGIWATSYLYLHHGISQEVAASYASYFFLGITVGRFICGFVAEKFGDRQLIQVGSAIAAVGVLGLICTTTAPIALVIIGLGCAPIYPAIIHATPDNFGAENSQAIIGVEMASAYVGIICAPALFGVLADITTIAIYPLFLFVLASGISIFSTRFYRNKEKKFNLILS